MLRSRDRGVRRNWKTKSEEKLSSELRHIKRGLSEINALLIPTIKRVSCSYHIKDDETMQNKMEEDLKFLHPPRAGYAQSHESLYDLIRWLQNDRMLAIWQNALMLWKEDERGGGFPNIIEVNKITATKIMAIRNEFVQRYERIQAELQENELEELSISLMSKITALDLIPEFYQPHFELYPLRLTARDSKGNSHAYSRIEQNNTSTLIAIVSIGIFTAFVPLILAYIRSPSQRGSVSDSDFYLLIQNSVMQLVGLVTAIYPFPTQLKSVPRMWILAFTIIGFISAILAAPAYVLLPVMWSALFSFAASAAQAFVVLQLALRVSEQPAGGEKEE